jgi:hypothetical protein
MFAWFRKREKKAPVEQTEAYKLGRGAAETMIADLDRFMCLRFGPVRDEYLKVLRNCFERSFNRPEAPPIIIARIEFKIFSENVDELRQKLPVDINAAMRDWRDWSDEMGIRTVFDKLVNNRVEMFMSNLTTDGLQMFLDLADGLKAADDRWRAAHPKKSAQFPQDQGPEIAAFIGTCDPDPFGAQDESSKFRR